MPTVTAHRTQSKALNQDNCRRMLLFHHLSDLFVQVIQFLDRNSTRICFVYPILNQLVPFVRDPLVDFLESGAPGDYSDMIASMLDILERMKEK
jgi:hypothetical protein